MSVIVGGKQVELAGVRSRSWFDDVAMRLGPNDRRRRFPVPRINSIIIHATVGDEPQIVRQGMGPPGMAARTANAWRADDAENRHAGSQLVVDSNGTVWCLADLLTEAAYHAEELNEHSIGIEIVQTSKLEIFTASCDALLWTIDGLTRLFGIQRQFHAPYLGDSHPVGRLARGGKDCMGIFGHRDATTKRGRGDPGDYVFEILKRAGYEPMNFETGEDLEIWKKRQAELCVPGLAIDGVPGPLTTAALLASGRRYGLWVPRPGD